MLYNLIILPIETIVDWVFTTITRILPRIGVIGAVAGVSIIINFLALPLYNIADSLQEKERRTAKALEYRVKRIKKAFKGDEQFMMLQTYYRQNNYHPLYVLRSSLSILIEIPFFIAAYHYLSNCELLRGSSFWIFKDLGNPDGLFSFTIGSVVIPVHILPILMTLINFISGAIYTKEAVLREKIQLYVVALLFLVLLYNSPSGLVIYWILNNLFSLVKNIVLKTRNPRRVLYVAVTSIAVCMCIYILLATTLSKFKIAFVLFILFVCAVPLMVAMLRKHVPTKEVTPDRKTFILFAFSSVGLAVLCGLLLPSNVISSSPIEFSFLGSTDNPASYVWYAFEFYIGLFAVWPMVIYFMFGPKVKIWMTIVFCVMIVYSLMNAFIFTSDYGTLNSVFSISSNEDALRLFNIKWILSLVAFILLVVAAVVVVRTKKVNICSYLIASCVFAELCLGCVKYNKIQKEYKSFEASTTRTAGNSGSGYIRTTYHLSKTKQNVIVIFLDRAIGTFIEPIFGEHPEIRNQYTGFVHYPNAVSFSNNTVMGSPAMLGG